VAPVTNPPHLGHHIATSRRPHAATFAASEIDGKDLQMARFIAVAAGIAAVALAAAPLAA
jgi:hypothetical protein